MNIAICGIAHETNTFSTLPTAIEDFTVIRGEEMISGELSAEFWGSVRSSGHIIHPIFRAYATPSGKVTRNAFETLLSELITSITESGSLDGVLLLLHGAMEVEEVGDGETAILRAVRGAIGEEPLVAVTLDLHANIAPEVARLADIVTAYRTAPHRDVEQTHIRGAKLLLSSLTADRRPHVSLVKIPLLVAGEAAVTEVEPSKSLFAELDNPGEIGSVLDASILIGCAWTDSPYTTVSVLACGTSESATRGHAEALADKVWGRRKEFSIDSDCVEPDEVVRVALTLPEGPVFVSDSGDNPTAGAAGDSPYFLKILLESGPDSGSSDRIIVAGIADTVAVAACIEKGVGQSIQTYVGGRLDSTTCGPLLIEGEIIRVILSDPKFGDAAIVRCGAIDVVIQSRRNPFTKLDDFARLEILPDTYRIVVVKLGYLFPELRDYAQHHIMAMTRGFGDQRIERLPFKRLKRPIYPLDVDTHFGDGGL